MKYLILITTVASYFVLPHPTLAAEFPINVFISEVNWAGSTSSNADEWLELTNPLEKAIDLSGWSIDGAATSGGVLALPEGASVASHSTYLIANYDASHSTLAVTPDFVTSAVALSNSGLRLVLRDRSSTEIDTVGDGGSPIAGSAAGGSAGIASMIWSLSGWISATISSGFDADVVQYGTPGALDITFAQSATSEPILSAEDVAEPVADLEIGPVAEPVVEPVVEPVIEPVAMLDADVGPETLVPPETIAEPETTIEPPTPSEPLIVLEDVALPELPKTNVIVGLPIIKPTYLPGVLLLNEIVSDPISGNEWVEIYNPTDKKIELEGWQVTEGGGQSIKFSGTIEATQYATVEFSNRLNNDGDRLQLLDPSGQVIDAVSFGGSADAIAPAARKPNALARDANGTWLVTTEPTRDDTNSITLVAVETKEAETKKEPVVKTKIEPVIVTTTATSTATTLRLLSALPNPVGSDESEYIVLENFGDELVELDGWTLADVKTRFALVGSLAAGLKLTLPKSITRITLNNDADSLTLTAPNGEVISTLSYENAQEGILEPSTNHSTQSPTASGAQDETATAAKADTKLVSSSTASSATVKTSTTTKKKTPTNARTVEGVVIAAPDTLGSQIMYIDGLQLYQYRGDFGELTVGDLIRASGTMSTANAESRLKIANEQAITIVGHETSEPLELPMSELGDEQVGRLVRVSGTVVDRGTDRFKLEADGSSVSVVLKDGAGISIASVSPGEAYEITGVLSRYNETRRLLPRETTDIARIETAAIELPASPDTTIHATLPWGLILVVLTTGGLILLAWRHQKKTLKPLFA